MAADDDGDGRFVGPIRSIESFFGLCIECCMRILRSTINKNAKYNSSPLPSESERKRKQATLTRIAQDSSKCKKGNKIKVYFVQNWLAKYSSFMFDG